MALRYQAVSSAWLSSVSCVGSGGGEGWPGDEWADSEESMWGCSGRLGWFIGLGMAKLELVVLGGSVAGAVFEVLKLVRKLRKLGARVTRL